MRWNFLSNKGSSAPYIYLLLQVVFISGAYISSPHFKNSIHSNLVIWFCLDCALTLVFYFATHLRDPGYVPNDGIFFTEQEEQWTRSQMKLQNNNNPNDVSHNMNNQQSYINDGKSVSKIIMKKMPSGGSDGEQEPKPNFEQMEDEEEDEGHESFYQEEDFADNHDVGVELQLQDNSESTKSQQELSQPASSHIHLPGERSVSDLEKNETDQKQMTSGPVGRLTSPKNQTSNVTTKDVTEGDQNIVPIMPQGNSHSQETNSSIALQTDQKLNTQEGLETTLQKKLSLKDRLVFTRKPNNVNSQDLDALETPKLTQLDSLPNQPPNRGISHTMKTNSTYMDAPGTVRTAAPTVYFANDIRKSTLADTIRGTPEFQDVNLDDNLQKDDLEAQKNNEQKLDINHIERRYCTVCNLEQPIRARHCKHCERCVASYDHHCPWLGTCIGEKNHFFFVWYLFFQAFEVAFAQFHIVLCFFDHDSYDFGIRLLQAVVAVGIGFFTLMNQTTWENLSWKKISYLKELPQNKGSPFSEGFTRNVTYCFFESYKGLKKWRYTSSYKASFSSNA